MRNSVDKASEAGQDAAAYDVIVVGGGASGLIAAVAAAKLGARTLLVERDGCFGGTATSAYVAQFIGFFNRELQSVFGLPLEFTRRIEAAGGSPGFSHYVLAEASANPIPITNFPFNPEIVKWVADEWLAEVGVDILLHASVVDVLKNGKTVEGIVVEDIGGRRSYGAKVVVDASGDAVAAHAAGVPMREQAEDVAHDRQPQSLVFRLSNVDVARFRAMPREEKRAIALRGVQSGELYWESLSFMSTPGGTDAICLMSRIKGLDALDPAQATEAERVGRQQVKTIVGFLKREVPGFENAIIANIASRIGVRETRRIVGAYTISEDDIMAETRFKDSIALGSGPMDIHEADGAGIRLFMPPAPFEIPMRCLVPAEVDGLIVTGRCISATRGANGGARHMATAMALGQAAGTMATVAAREANTTQAIPVQRVQELLRREGAIVTVPECLAANDAVQKKTRPVQFERT
jgi:hypothetical protein